MEPASSKKGTMEEIKVLLNSVKSSDWWVRKESIRKLLDYPEDLFLADLEAWLRNGEDALSRNASMETYRELGERALGSLVFLLRDEDADVRIFSANVLGDIRESSALGALVTALQDPDDNVRIAVAEALGKIGDERAVAPLVASLGDMSWASMAAIGALGKIGGSSALSALHACLENKDYRGMACAALEQTGDRSSLEHLIPLLEYEDVRQLALQAIVGIAEKEKIELSPSLFSRYIEQLTDWLSSPQEAVRKTAFIALSWSGDRRGMPHFLKAIQDELLPDYALNGLLSLGKSAVPEIVEALKKSRRNKGILAKVISMLGANSSLMPFADDEDDEVRAEVALALGSIRTPEAVEALLALSRDHSEEVRAAALLSLRNSER
jgi:HEAT repeat protein